MITRATRQIKWYWEGWAKKRNRPGNTQALNSRNIYILPSGFGLIYSLVVIILFLVSINYQINTVFLMTFLLITIGLVSAWEAHANFNNLSFRFITIEDAEQGTPAKIAVFIQANDKCRFGIEFQIASQPKIRLEKIPPEGLQFIIPIETKTRGYFSVPKIVISSLYPFGIFRVWSYAYFEEYYYVYPQPIDPGFWPDPCLYQDIKKNYTTGDEEFYDLKLVENPWTEPHLIAWKIAAKGQGWYLKKMASNEADYWLFKLTDLAGHNLEIKLQHLSYWLQTAESNNLIYALKLTASSHIKFGRGKEHLKHCLRQLALYQ
ncbi:MAG: hypothetical protein ACYCQI_02525 [Gammaproteobacteria bacterium]